jgi:hypothetical protein
VMKSAPSARRVRETMTIVVAPRVPLQHTV